MILNKLLKDFGLAAKLLDGLKKVVPAVVLALVTLSPALADSIWLVPIDGDFVDPTNWDNGVPGQNDTAIFNQAGNYVVSLPSDTLTQHERLEVSSGHVTFDLGSGASPGTARYRITDEYNSPTSYIGVGSFSGGSPELAEVTVTGGRVDAGELVLGLYENSTGILNIIGNGPSSTTESAEWRSVNGFNFDVVGSYGTGILNITNGGIYRNDSVVTIAENSGSSGTVNVDGAGSYFDASGAGVDVGSIYNNSSASINVTNGGLFAARTIALRNSENTNNININVDGAGSQIVTSSSLAGFSGNSSISVTNGGLIDAGSISLGNSILGWANPIMHISGDGTVNTMTLNVEGDTDSTLILSGGISLNVVDSPTVSRGFIQLGESGGDPVNATGTLELRDSGTSLTAVGARLGGRPSSSLGQRGGIGELVVGAGTTADIETTTWLYEHGTIRVTGGDFSSGRIENLDGGTLDIQSGSVTAGEVIYGTNNITIDTTAAGPVSTLSAGAISSSGAITVGNTNAGVLSISPSFGTSAISNSSELIIGENAGSNGSVNVGGRWNVSGNASVGGTAASSGGTGSLNVDNQGTIYIGDTLKVWLGGTFIISHGGHLKATTVNLNDAGSLTLNGELEANNIIGDLELAQGLFSAGVGRASVFDGGVDNYEIATIDGDLTMGAMAGLAFDVAGFAAGVDLDFLNVLGTATLDGSLSLDLRTLSLPAVGTTFDILTADTIVGVFDDVIAAGLDMTWDLQIDYILDPGGQDTVRLTVLTAVPIPAAAWLFLSALAFLGLTGTRTKTQ